MVNRQIVNNMKHQYLSPLCEEIKVTAISELLAGSSIPAGKYLNVTNGTGDIHAE